MNQRNKLLFVLLLAGPAVGCKYAPHPTSNQMACAAEGKSCPDGYYCASDMMCWKNGEGPVVPDGGGDKNVPDAGGSTDLGRDVLPETAPPVVPAPSTHAVVPGGGTASSASYRIVKTTAQSPGGNRVHESNKYRMVGGLVGTTQQ